MESFLEQRHIIIIEMGVVRLHRLIIMYCSVLVTRRFESILYGERERLLSEKKADRPINRLVSMVKRRYTTRRVREMLCYR